MLLRRAPKSVWCVGRSVRSFSAATNAKRNDSENERDDTANHATQRGKRVSRSQRRAMVEAFVNQYKAMNTGKVPGVHVTRKEVGGSFYVVKNILQELEHSARTCNTNQSSVRKEEANKRRCSSNPMAASERKTSARMDAQARGKHVETQRVMESSSSSSRTNKSLSEQGGHQAKEGRKSNFDSSCYEGGLERDEAFENRTTTWEKLVEEDQSKGDIVAFSSSEESISSRMNGARALDGEKNTKVSEDLQERGVLQDKTGPEEQKTEHKQSMPISLVVKDPKESTLWVSIKSFANGLINIWRKS